MNTRHLQPNPEGIDEAARLLKAGELVAIPTETVYGLAADAMNGEAVSSIYVAKGRPSDNPLIVHIADTKDWEPLVTHIPDNARELAAAYWPGPLTIILPASEMVPKVVTGGLSTVAVRFPSHPIAQAVILHSGCPLAAPSANRSGSPSPTNAQRVTEDMEGRISAILDGGVCDVGVESTVIDLCHTPPRLLRPGGITAEMLEDVLGPIEIDPAVTHALEKGAVAASPGMKYKHYAPKAEITIVKGSPAAYAAYVNARKDNAVGALCFDEDLPTLSVPAVTYGSRNDALTQAQKLFDALRQLDEIGIRTVYAACPDTSGIGLAVYNRLLRAAAFRVECAIHVVGLTGPTGSGKTTVADVWREQGAYIIDTDKLARQVTAVDSPYLAKLADVFSTAILNEDGTLNRAELAKRAFATLESAQQLNAITHPAIVALTRQEIEHAAEQGYSVAVVDAPLLYEAKADELCDMVVAVIASADVRKQRIMVRDNLTAEQAEQRMAVQKPDDFYCRDGVTVLDGGTAIPTLQQAAKICLSSLF